MTPNKNEGLIARPVRVQLSRQRGWRMPENTVKVDRTTRWGNPWTEGDPGRVRISKGCEINLPMAVTRAGVIDRFRRWMTGEFVPGSHGHPVYEAVIPPSYPHPDPEALRGMNLACWCRLDQPCHADVLLELANRPLSSTADGGALRPSASVPAGAVIQGEDNRQERRE